MKTNRYLVIGIIILVVVGILLLISNTQKEQIKKCREGFTQLENGCTTEKTDFECIDKLILGKGYAICNKLITNIELIDNYRQLAESNTTLKIKGRIWQDYQFCPSNLNVPVQMTCDFPVNNIEIISFETAQ